MATDLLVTLETKIASLTKLALESKGVAVTAVFWFRLPEADHRSLALVIPLADKLGARDVYGRVMEILDKETFAPKSFLLSRLAVFGERESAEALSALRAQSSLVSKLDHYRNVEIENVPEAADVREDLMLDFWPDGVPKYSKYFCRVFFRPFRYSGVVPSRGVESESELKHILRSLEVRNAAKERILSLVKAGQQAEAFISDVSLYTLYHLNLVWVS